MNGKKLFGTNGIRGMVNKELTVELAVKVGLSVGTFFSGKKLLIGRDARTSGAMLTKAVTAGLMATGCCVFDDGMAPTPALQYAVKANKLAGGVIITASHNPPEYNGIKVLWSDGVEISHEQEDQIEQLYYEGKPRLSEWHNIGLISKLQGVNREYVEAVKTHVNVNLIATKRFHVIVDPANSVGSLTAPRLLKDLGCKVTTINANIDGTFPGRMPEPRPENLHSLAATVKTLGADIGIAYDGDADRAIFVGETGEVYMGDKTFALIAKSFLQKNPGARIVTPVSSSTLIKDVAETYGGEIVWTKVGSVTVAQKMKELGAMLGGEENGGVFYGQHQPVRDGAMTTALILEIMAETGKKLSELIGEQPQYFIEKGKVECPEEKKEKVLEKLRAQTSSLKTSTIDGVKIWFDDGGAILIRPSGTEPVYRLYAEAKNSEKAARLIEKYAAMLKQIIQSI
jgi:phosphomannomutase/phosphoglucomutase